MMFKKSSEFNEENFYVLDQLINHSAGSLNDEIILFCDYKRSADISFTMKKIHEWLANEKIIIDDDQELNADCFPYKTVDMFAESGINYYSIKHVITEICSQLQVVVSDKKIAEILNGKTMEDLENHFVKVDKIRKAIADNTTMFTRLYETPNSFYGVLPFDGSLILSESYGSPNAFYTPLGKFGITGGGCSNGVVTEDILNKLGIKYTRLSDMKVTKNGCFGGLIQIDEDHLGNVYPPVDKTIALLGGIFGEEYVEMEEVSDNNRHIVRDFSVAHYIFDKIEEKHKLLERRER